MRGLMAMKLTGLLTAFALALALPGTTSAQDNAPYCESNSGFDQFDFWVGEWNVSGTINGTPAGTNSIFKAASGCFLYENWTSTTGGVGKSINYYNPITDKWRQVWISAVGYAIDIEGGIVDGSMTLIGSIYYYGTGQTTGFRGTWTPNEDGSVRQFFEQYDSEKAEWNIWFDGTYVRQ
jgi:hypothetical protein